MVKIVAISFFLLLTLLVPGLSQERGSYNKFLDLSLTVGQRQKAAAASFIYNFGLGPRRRFEIGTGARITSYVGRDKEYITAGPARYTRTYTTPFAIFFAGQQENNFDTLTLARPLTHSINATINLGYYFTDKFFAGFNIDLVGFTVGRETHGVLTGDGLERQEPKARPTSFNLLLTGDHDKGSLNSEFFLRYQIAGRWNIKAVYQFLFSEYKTTTVSQTFSDNRQNRIFRNKANNFGLGLAWQLK